MGEPGEDRKRDETRVVGPDGAKTLRYGPLLSPGKILAYTLKPVDAGGGPVVVGSIVELLDYLREQIECSEVGDSFRIGLVEMTRDELQNLPEHEGW